MLLFFAPSSLASPGGQGALTAAGEALVEAGLHLVATPSAGLFAGAASTLNTGNLRNERTVERLERI